VFFISWYYFDTRDDGAVVTDDVGIELVGLDAVKALTARSLAELVLEVLPGSLKRCLGVDVPDEQSRPVLTTELVYHRWERSGHETG
jgi:hypothetical protein